MAGDNKNMPSAPSDEQTGPFKKKRGGVVLSKSEVEQIKEGRKKLRAEMRAQGIKSKKDFELTASSLGLYFDKNKHGALLLWFFLSKGGWLLLALAGLLMLALYGISTITELKGHFTISMGEDLFREGFTLSETGDFAHPTTHLFCTPAENIPCISITYIPEDVDERDGQQHTERYFAYTYYIRNDGESTVDYTWELRLNSESNELSSAAWFMIFEDGEMQFYAEAKENGELQALPDLADESGYAYSRAPLYDKAADPEGQYELLKETEALTYWRLIPKPFASEDVVATGGQTGVAPGDVHKYTIVIWLEGDDPDCTNDLIGGHLGLDMYMSMVE